MNETETKVLAALNQVTSGVTNPQQWLIDAVNGGKSTSGQTVSVATVLGLPVVWNALQLISGHIGMLPLQLRRNLPNGGSEVMESHTLNRLMNFRPNAFSTPSMFRETLQNHALLTGNGLAWINRRMGVAKELLILPPENTQLMFVDGKKYAYVWLDIDYYPSGLPYESPIEANGQTTKRHVYFIPDDDLLHIPGLGWNGKWGMSLLQIAKNVFGIDQAGQDSAGFSFANNGRPGLILEAPMQAFRTQKEAEEFMASFNKAHQGIDKAGRTGLLREGMKAHTLPMSAADSQFIASREFSREDLALFFGTQLLMESNSVYRDLSERNAAYIQNVLGKWFAKWTDECDLKLISGRQRGVEFWQFDSGQLHLSNRSSTADYTSKLRQQGIINGDEARAMHGLNPAGLTDFTNPNNATSGDADPPAEQMEEDDEDTEEIVRNAVRITVGHNLNYERRRVVDAAQREGNFLHWCDIFYPMFQAKLEATCKSLGIASNVAEKYCDQSKQDILGVCGVVDADGLVAAITDMTVSWESRIKGFTDV